ncbi:hypothetical protein HGRIS_011415 [Hohenbuehelia grisea]|uniref:DNA mismatch repair protein n=1 Tax=Hohenbuehelia grisea TaxID=104357 RepID=A0ABR3JWR7_9AGAR
MPPKAKASTDSLKQKSLMSFFGAKDTAPKEVKKPIKQGEKPKPKATSTSTPSIPVSRESSSRTLETAMSSSPPSSTHGGSMRDSPPTSDPVDVVDVDMISDDENEAQPTKARTVQKKRKIVTGDSDSDTTFQTPAKSSHRSSSPGIPLSVSSRNKKQRLSVPISDDEDEDLETTSNFSQRITRFKKSPQKKGRKSKGAASDDDDFIEPTDSDSDAKSVKSTSSRSSHSSRRSVITSDESEVEEDEKPTKSKAKTKAKPRPSMAKSSSAGGSSGSGLFLTAAEQREQGRKDEKKAAEDAYSFLLDVKDKDKKRPGEPGYDPRTLYIPPKAWNDFTPFEKQFWEIKQNHYDTVLFFQKGKFFELYEDDARIGHQEFDLKLTQRVKMSMVGVPEMSFSFWAAKFLGKGYKVGRVDQAETALGAEMRLTADKGNKGKPKKAEDKAKDKIVRRELNKVYTNGTLVDPELLTDEQAGHCISIREVIDPKSDNHPCFGICVLDTSTSEFNMSSFEDDICRTRLETMMRQLRPKEMIFTKGSLSVSTTRLLKLTLPASCLWTSLREVEGFTYDQTLVQLRELYPAEEAEDDAMTEGEPLGESVPQSIRDMVGCRDAIEALGAMIWYLRQLNIDKDILTMKNFNVYDPMKRGQGLVLDGQTLAHLEILLNNEGTEEGSLLKLLGRCVTAFGKRLFRIWLCMPLREVSDINARLDAVEDIMEHPTFEDDFMKIAKGLPDLERIVSRIHANNCKVKDFVKVLSAFKKLSRGFGELAKLSEEFKSKTILGLLRGAPDLMQNIKNVESMYRSPNEKDDELLPQEGKDEAYDEVMGEIRQLEEELEEELKKYEKKLGCSLSYWHSAIGNKDIYLIQTKAAQKNIPKDWTKSSSTKANSRWLAVPLMPTIRKLKEARETRSMAIKNFRNRVYAEFDTDRAVWLRAVRVFAELDCLFSLAKSSTAIGEPSCRPEFVEGDSAFVDFKELRHPTLCLSTTLRDFIPNDVHLGGEVGRIALLTGPNMAGKSTAMRMTATGVIMAQLGMMVPASSASLCPVDSILTRMGAYDNMFSNSSTFKVELDECCKILRDATPKSLVILDELGRGTSTYDGMAIAGAVLHQLATHTLPLAFFATHYGSLTDDFAYHPSIRRMHMKTMVDDEKRDLVFLYQLVDGAAISSFGTHVANLAGVPMEVVERADAVSKQFAQQFKEKLQIKQKTSASAKLPLTAQADFTYLYGLATGKIEMPSNAACKKEVLLRLKDTVRRYLA